MACRCHPPVSMFSRFFLHCCLWGEDKKRRTPPQTNASLCERMHVYTHARRAAGAHREAHPARGWGVGGIDGSFPGISAPWSAAVVAGGFRGRSCLRHQTRPFVPGLLLWMKPAQAETYFSGWGERLCLASDRFLLLLPPRPPHLRARHPCQRTTCVNR